MSAAAVGSAGKLATPMLDLTVAQAPPPTSIDSSSEAERSRSASWRPPSASVEGSNTVNSSPPYREARSTSRTLARIADANARIVPMAVVDLLEIVEVGHHDRDVVAEALSTCHLGPKRLVELSPICELGQLVGGRKLPRKAVQVRVLQGD